MLRDKFAFLAKNPLLGDLREDFGAGVRTFVAERYLILYRAQNYGVEIIQVVHSARGAPCTFHGALISVNSGGVVLV